jgi:hypothetical protein
MNSEAARELLAIELVHFDSMSYAEAKTLIGRTPRTKEIVGSDQRKYQVEAQAFWDSKPDGDVRIICSVDDGGIRALAPMTDGVIKTKNAEPVGMRRRSGDE